MGATGATGATGGTGATGATGAFATALVGADATPSSTYVFASGTLPFPTNTAGPTGGMAINGATGTVTVPDTATYRVSATVSFVPNASGSIVAGVEVNGGPGGQSYALDVTSAANTLFAFSWLSDLTAGDTLAIKFTGITPSQAQIVSANLSVEKAS